MKRKLICGRMTGILAIAILWLVGTAGTGWSGAFEEGLNFFEGGHYRWALEKFIEASDQAPREPQRWWYMAESYRMLGDTPPKPASGRTTPPSQRSTGASYETPAHRL